MDKMKKIEELRNRLLKLSNEELNETVEHPKNKTHRYDVNGWLRFDLDRISRLAKPFNSPQEMIKTGNAEEKAAGRYIENGTVDRDEVAPHFKPVQLWTYESCKETAAKYKTRKEFWDNDNSCAIISKNNGWFDEITLHMPLGHNQGKGKTKYTFEYVKEATKSCTTVKDIIDATNRNCYKIAKANGWLEKLGIVKAKRGISKGFKYSEETKEKMRKPKPRLGSPK